MTTQICLVPKTSNIGCACYVRHRYVADRLAKVTNLIGDPILGVKKTEVKPEVLETQAAYAFYVINRGHFYL